MKVIVRTDSYQDDLAAIQVEIFKDNPSAALDMWFHIDDQVEQPSDPNYPRKRGWAKETFELVAHKNYIAVLK